MRTTILPVSLAWFRAIRAATAIALALIALSVGAFVAAMLTHCTPAARVQAGQSVSALGPILCTVLMPLATPDNKHAGMVCADAAKLLGGVLQLASSSPPAGGLTRVVSAGPETCEPVMLSALIPERDPREYVCRHAMTDSDIRRAFSIGHAR